MKRVKGCAEGAPGKDLPSGELDRIESAGLEFHKRVRAEYLVLAKRESDRICLVDGRLKKEEIAEIIKKIVLEKLNA